MVLVLLVREGVAVRILLKIPFPVDRLSGEDTGGTRD
jgi:hypothetical protein